MELLTNIAIDAIRALSFLYILAILLRFTLQIGRADFYNPVSQAVARVTDPMARLFRRFIPGYRNIDFALLVLAMLVRAVALYVIFFLLTGELLPAAYAFISSFFYTIVFLIQLYFYAIIVTIILSFVMVLSGHMNPHPIARLVWQLTDPVLSPFRRIIPSLGGLDFSPIIVFIILNYMEILLLNAQEDLMSYLGYV
ncbi:MAG: YggT family protein [Pseudohongiellaceae bacterium]